MASNGRLLMSAIDASMQLKQHVKKYYTVESNSVVKIYKHRCRIILSHKIVFI